MIAKRLSDSKRSTGGAWGCIRPLTAKHARAVILSHRQQIPQAARNLAPHEALRVLKQQVQHSVHIRYTQLEVYLMGKQLPYQPMRGPQKPVSQDRMQEILSKNAPKAAQSAQQKSGPECWPTAPRENAPSTQPPRPSGKLQWADREPGSMGRYDTTHWYSCCQIGRPPNETFEVWTREPLTGGMKQLVLGLKSFGDGIRAAQKDADEHYARGDR